LTNLPKGQADPDKQRPDKWSSTVIWKYLCTPKMYNSTNLFTNPIRFSYRSQFSFQFLYYCTLHLYYEQQVQILTALYINFSDLPLYGETINRNISQWWTNKHHYISCACFACFYWSITEQSLVV